MHHQLEVWFQLKRNLKKNKKILQLVQPADSRHFQNLNSKNIPTYTRAYFLVLLYRNTVPVRIIVQYKVYFIRSDGHAKKRSIPLLLRTPLIRKNQHLWLLQYLKKPTAASTGKLKFFVKKTFQILTRYLCCFFCKMLKLKIYFFLHFSWKTSWSVLHGSNCRQEDFTSRRHFPIREN